MLVSTLSSWVINLPFDPLSKKFRNAFLFTVFCSLKGYYNLFLEKEQSNIWVLFFSCFIKAKNDLNIEKSAGTCQIQDINCSCVRSVDKWLWQSGVRVRSRKTQLLTGQGPVSEACKISQVVIHLHLLILTLSPGRWPTNSWVLQMVPCLPLWRLTNPYFSPAQIPVLFWETIRIESQICLHIRNTC